MLVNMASDSLVVLRVSLSWGMCAARNGFRSPFRQAVVSDCHTGFCLISGTIWDSLLTRCSADSVFAWPYDVFPRMVSDLLLSNLQMFLVSLCNANSVHVRVNKREGLHYWVPRSRFWCFGKLVWGDLMLFCFLSSEGKKTNGCRDLAVVKVLMLLRRWLREELLVTAEHLKHYHTYLTKFNYTFSVF